MICTEQPEAATKFKLFQEWQSNFTKGNYFLAPFPFFPYFDSFCRILMRYLLSLLTACGPVSSHFVFVWLSEHLHSVLFFDFCQIMSDQVRISELQQEWQSHLCTTGTWKERVSLQGSIFQSMLSHDRNRCISLWTSIRLTINKGSNFSLFPPTSSMFRIYSLAAFINKFLQMMLNLEIAKLLQFISGTNPTL